MKNNAIIRIILWSIILVVLAGVLLCGLLLQRGFWDITIASSGEQGEAAVPSEPPQPVSGSDITLDAGQVSDIEIDWAAGSIAIQGADVEAIEISESDVSDSRYAMVWKLKGNKLSIKFCEEDLLNVFHVGKTPGKDLTILVPREWQADSLEIDSASADMSVTELVIDKAEIDSASGICEFTNCVVNSLEIDTASGDITYSGTLDSLDCEAASASVYAMLDNVPSRIEMDSMSGDLDITLPEYAGFTASIDAMSSDFLSDFETVMQNGKHVCGDGSCRINVSAMSGSISIRKSVAAAATAQTHEHTEECTTHPDSCPLTSSTEHHGGEHE